MSITNIVGQIFNVYYILIIVYILMSWLPGGRQNEIGELLGRIVEPYLGIFRKIIPPIGMMDFSPIIAIFALFFVEQGVVQVLSLLFP